MILSLDGCNFGHRKFHVTQNRTPNGGNCKLTNCVNMQKHNIVISVVFIISTPYKIWSAGLGSRSGHNEDFESGTCGPSSLVLDVDGRVQGNSSRAALPLTRRQRSIPCESNCVAHDASKRRWTPHRPLVALRKECKSK